MKQKTQIAWLFCSVYFITYLVRNSYSAVLVEIIADLEVSKQLASIAVTGSFFTYGLGQFISGRLGDRFQPHKIILAGLISTSLINLLIAMIPNIYFMNVLWILSGMFHSLIWSPLVRLVAHTYPDTVEFNRVIGKINQGSYIGIIVIYLAASLLVSFLHWQLLFVITGIISLLFSAVWYRMTRSIHLPKSIPQKERESSQTQPFERLTLSRAVSIGMIPVLVSSLCIGFLKDGIATWMPVYFSETHGLNSGLSILTSVILPICAVIMVDVIARLSSVFHNDMKCNVLLFGAASLFCLLLRFFHGSAVMTDLMLMALLTCSLRGSSFMLTSYIPHHFVRFGKVSTVSGLINGFIYLGSGAAAYSIALISDLFGWEFNITVWLSMFILCLILCFLAVKPWENFCRK